MVCRLIFILAFLFPPIVYASNMLFAGNLVVPNCTVNGGATIQFEWKDVEIQEFTSEGGIFRQKDMLIPINCPYALGVPKIKVTGAKGKAVNALQTSKYPDEKLAIYLWSGSNSLGSWSNIIIGDGFRLFPSSYITGSGSDKMLHFKVALTREGGMELLKPGPFTAAANLELRYE